MKDLTPKEKEKAQQALCFLNKKSDRRIKARTVYNGKPTREWLTREDSSSPTALSKGVMLTTVVDAKKEQTSRATTYPMHLFRRMSLKEKQEMGTSVS